VACHPLSAKELLVVAQFDVGLLRLPLVLLLQMELETKLKKNRYVKNHIHL